MAKIKPFNALRPRREVASKVASVPYDVVDTSQARSLSEGNPLSFLHVVRPEIDLPDGTDLYADEVYQTAAVNLRKLVEDSVLVKEESPSLYLYAQQMGDHRQVGLVCCCAVRDYEDNVIRKHEFTRPDKENDRTRHVDVTNANTGPVFLTYRADSQIDSLVARILASEQPLYDFTALDGIGHTVHRIADPDLVSALVDRFEPIERTYVADGHHRSASAARVGRERRLREGNAPGEKEYDWFMAVLFPHDQLRIMAYNRVVRTLGEHDLEGFMQKVRQAFTIEPLTQPAYAPQERHHIGMYLQQRWHRLVPREGTFPKDHPTDSLDASILQKNLLYPILGIGDPRTDKRIDFVGGIHGPKELERLVDSGEYAVAFALYPVSLEELMAVADADLVMPPKSTWFEPKLRSGLLIHELD